MNVIFVFWIVTVGRNQSRVNQSILSNSIQKGQAQKKISKERFVHVFVDTSNSNGTTDLDDISRAIQSFDVDISSPSRLQNRKWCIRRLSLVIMFF